MWPTDHRPLSSVESSVIEENAVALGVTIDGLMENAGRAVAEEAAKHLPSAPAPVAIVAGTGNNGGDGTSAAHYLAQWGYAPEIWLVRPASEIRSRTARRCFERIERRAPVHLGVPTPEDLRRFPLIVDALLGTGQSGALRAPYGSAVSAIQASGVPILSIDEPTGLGGPDALRPQWTVALSALKEGMTPARCGELVLRDIGIPAEAWLRTGPGEFVLYRPVTLRRGRGRAGRILVIGGGPYSGAPALAALSALRTGAERATVLAPKDAAERIQAFSPNLVVRGIGTEAFSPHDVAGILSFVRAAPSKAIAIGMGAGRSPGTLAAVEQLLRELPAQLPVVVDADALEVVGRGVWTGRSLVATPNAGEYARVFGGDAARPLSEQIDGAQRVARERGILLVVKGEPDIVTDGQVAIQNYHHHIAQTVSGVGDVLAGTLASLLAQGLPPLHAARLGTFWVGDAGIRAAGRKSFGVMATDIVEELPSSLLAGLDRISRGG